MSSFSTKENPRPHHGDFHAILQGQTSEHPLGFAAQKRESVPAERVPLVPLVPHPFQTGSSRTPHSFHPGTPSLAPKAHTATKRTELPNNPVPDWHPSNTGPSANRCQCTALRRCCKQALDHMYDIQNGSWSSALEVRHIVIVS